MAWEALGTFILTDSNWQFTNTGGLPIDESGDLAVRFSWGPLDLSKPLGSNLLIADTYYIGPVPHLATVRKTFFQRNVGQIIVFSVPGTYQDSGDNFSAPGAFLWQQIGGIPQINPLIRRELGLKRTPKTRGFRKGRFPKYPWDYATDNLDLGVQIEVYTG